MYITHVLHFFFFILVSELKESLVKHEAMATNKKSMTYAEYVVYRWRNPGPKSMKSFERCVELGYIDDPKFIESYLRERGRGRGHSGRGGRGRGGGGLYKVLFIVSFIFLSFCIYLSSLFSFVYIYRVYLVLYIFIEFI